MTGISERLFMVAPGHSRIRAARLKEGSQKPFLIVWSESLTDSCALTALMMSVRNQGRINCVSGSLTPTLSTGRRGVNARRTVVSARDAGIRVGRNMLDGLRRPRRGAAGSEHDEGGGKAKGLHEVNSSHVTLTKWPVTSSSTYDLYRPRRPENRIQRGLADFSRPRDHAEKTVGVPDLHKTSGSTSKAECSDLGMLP